MKNLAPLLVLLPLSSAIPQRRIPDVLARIKQQQKLQLTAAVEDDDDASSSEDDDVSNDVKTSYFDQRLDHFFSGNGKDDDGKVDTFKQRYFYSSRYVQSNDTKNSDSDKKTLAFLCVGGEGPSLTKHVLVDSVHCSGDMIGLAEKLNKDHGYDVHLFALEHRFYGESFPSQKGAGYYLRGENEDEEDETFEVDLTYLSSRQAVKDIAEFVKSAPFPNHQSPGNTKKEEDKKGDVTWITFGGSYPGMLAAWSHLLHPDLIFAAVSNSAPIQARLDFQQYHEHVGADLLDESVGGSEQCHSIVVEGHEQAVDMLEGKNDEQEGEDGAGMEYLARLFNVCGGVDSLRASKRNQESFIGDGLLWIPAQENDPNCSGEVCNIRGLCNAIINERQTDPDKPSVEILASISNMQSGYGCTQVDWNSYVYYFTAATKRNANARSWEYQTCSEFGFYQTCNEDSTCPYARGYHDVSRDLEFCQLVFGISPEDVKKNVDSTLDYYGGWSLTPNTGEQVGPNFLANNDGEDTLNGQKRIISVTGTVDPWTELSLTEDKANADHPSLSVAGASHHFWTHEIKDNDGDAVMSARQSIYETVSGWLGVEPIDKGVSSLGVDTIAMETM